MTAPVAPPLGTVDYAPLVARRYLLQIDKDGNPYGPPLLGDGVRVTTEAPADRPPLLVRITSASTADGGNIVLSWRRLTLYCSATGAAGPQPAEVQAGHLAEAGVRAHEGGGTHRGQRPPGGDRGGHPRPTRRPDEDIPRFQLTVDVLLRAGHYTPGRRRDRWQVTTRMCTPPEPLVTGSCLVAPLGTVGPTDATTAPGAAFIDLGHVGRDGFTETMDRTVDKKKNFGGKTVKILQTGYVHTFKFILLESLKAEVLKAVYGADNVEVTPATDLVGGTVHIKKTSEEAAEAVLGH